MAFDRKGFISAAKSQGMGDEEINATLVKQGVKPLNAGEKILYSKAIPWAGSAVGAAAAGLPTGGLGAPYGAAVGGFGMNAIQNSLKDLLGYQESSPIDQVTGAAMQSSGAAAITQIPALIKALVNPLGTVQDKAYDYRYKKLTGMEIDLDKTRSGSMEQLKNSPWYRQSPPQSRVLAESSLNDYYNQVSPIVTSNPSAGGTITGSSTIGQNKNISINELYNQLNPFEKQGKAYLSSGEASSTALGQGRNLASHAIRDYLNTQVPQSVSTANSIYSKAASLPKVLNAGPTGALGGYLLKRYIFDLISNSDK